MQKITDLSNPDLTDNTIIGQPKSFLNSDITFFGTGNIIVFQGDDIKIKNSSFTFKGNNSIIYLNHSKEEYSLRITAYSMCVVFIGKDIAINNYLEIIVSEAKTVFIGDDCLFSSQCLIRSSDAHALYDLSTGLRINNARSVFIGDHVWFGARVVCLKGSRVYSGSVIGSDSVLTGKEYYSNNAYGGNPAKQIRSNIGFLKKGTHALCDNMKEQQLCAEEEIKTIRFDNNTQSSIVFQELEEALINSETSAKKSHVLTHFYQLIIIDSQKRHP